MIRAPQDLLVRTELQDPKDPLAQQDKMAALGLWVCQVSLELQVLQDLQV